MFSFLFFSIGRAWQGFWRNAAMSLAATATMTLMLLLLSGFWIIQAGFLASLSYVEDKVGVVADLEDGTTALEVRELQTRLEALTEVREVTYISKERALENYRDERAKQGQPDLTPYLAENPLPASLEVKLDKPESYRRVFDYLRAEEIEVMRLVGASDAFIRWPFVFEGALVGLLGAVVTLGVLVGAAEPLSQFMVSFFEILPISVGSISRDVTVLVVGSGMGLGVIGAWVSVRTYLIR